MVNNSLSVTMSAVKAARKSNSIEEFVEHVTNPPMKKKLKGRVIAEQQVRKTGRPCCGDRGLLNPVKLNLSEVTLKKLKELKKNK